jgi:hypothetical protein
MRVTACRTRMKVSERIENRIDEVHGSEWYIPWERWTRTIGISISWSVSTESLPTTMHMNWQNSPCLAFNVEKKTENQRTHVEFNKSNINKQSYSCLIKNIRDEIKMITLSREVDLKPWIDLQSSYCIENVIWRWQPVCHDFYTKVTKIFRWHFSIERPGWISRYTVDVCFGLGRIAGVLKVRDLHSHTCVFSAASTLFSPLTPARTLNRLWWSQSGAFRSKIRFGMHSQLGECQPCWVKLLKFTGKHSSSKSS